MSKKLAPHLQKGKNGERRACLFLATQGLDIVAKNERSPYGEIDLIAKQGELLIFVEVRSRKTGAIVSAAASITPQKQEKLRKTALFYLQKHYQNFPPCRFDAICLDGEEITWLKNIF